MSLPLAIVGMSYREAPSATRAALIRLDDAPDSPGRELISKGVAAGVVRIETCSRVEWILSAEEAGWAGELLRGGLLSRLGGGQPRTMHVRVGMAALHYLLRVASGLESIAQGEHAVGRQVLRAFEKAHHEGHTDRVLHASWRVTGEMLNELREALPERQAVGVQTLAVRSLESHGVRKDGRVLVFGQGEIGRAAMRALERAGYKKLAAFRRATMAEFEYAAKTARAVVVCSGAPDAWLHLPRRDDGPVVVDVGSPAQVAEAPGWDSVSLDRLLEDTGVLLRDDASEALVDICTRAAARLTRSLEAPPPARTLAAIDEARKDFLQHTLPPLLQGLPPQRAKEVLARVSEFTHRLLRETRGGAQ